MKESRIIMIIIAVFFIVAGIGITVGALAAKKFDFGAFSTQKLTENRIEITEDFDNISIEVDVSDLSILSSDDESCLIICTDTEKVKHTASIKGDTLVISNKDERKWYDHIGFFFGNISLKIYLPKAVYSALNVESDTGDISSAAEISFNTAKIETDTGDVIWNSPVSDSFSFETDTGNIALKGFSLRSANIDTDTGNINLEEIEVAERLKISTDTGNIKLLSSTAGDIEIKSSTGDILLSEGRANGALMLKSSTGDVKFDAFDAEEIDIRTSTGNVKGTLLSKKIFVTKTSTGNIRVSESTEGGICRITTSTGDIEIRIEE